MFLNQIIRNIWFIKQLERNFNLLVTSEPRRLKIRVDNEYKEPLL